MRTIAVANQKGGTGKTTTAVNLAAAMGENGARVLVVDIDPQASATAWLGVEPNDSAASVIAGRTPIGSAIVTTSAPNVSLLPSSRELAAAEVELSKRTVGASTVLRRALASLPAGAFDMVVIDTPPVLGHLTVNALLAAGEVIAPVEARIMSAAGLGYLVEMLEEVRQAGEHSIELAGVLVCRYDGRTRHAREIVGQLRQAFGGKVFETMIRESIRLGECPSFGVPIGIYAPDSSGADDYRSLAREITGGSNGKA